MEHTFYTDKQKEKSKKIIQDLVDDFTLRNKELTADSYKEDNVRKDFIDKFFSALGWDMYNEKKLHEDVREVVHEDRLKIKGKTKAPDYGFKIGKSHKFYVEAKAPHIDLNHDKAPAHQVRIYGYNKKLSISILTDFEEFAIYDTKYPPKEDDQPDVARIKYYRFDQYIENFDEIWNWCSKDALYNVDSEYNKQEKKKIKKGEKSVDENFLDFLTDCRESLAKNIATQNKDEHFDAIQFNHIVQVLLDRIIFLRIAEDRAIEEYGMLEALTKSKDIYVNLNKLFKKFETKYNSTLFKKEDTVFNKIKISDATIKKVLKGFYYPNPYEFSVMPVEILGSIYEQFLGSIIRVTPTGSVKVEEKPEVRKAGGVYYTPQYIVDYIVGNTVGELIKDKTPDDVSKIKVLDPACGSGSFLIGAYEYLLSWHLTYYTKTKKDTETSIKKGFIYEFTYKNDVLGKVETIYKLSVEEKRRILLNNIHGVDIDAQAVEVTKLSLNLKMLEDENYETKDTLFKNIGIAALSDLSENNIKCGNSLIASDYYSFVSDRKKEIKDNIEKLEDKKDKKSVAKINDLKNELVELNDINNDPNPFDWDAEGEFDKKTKTWDGRGFPEIMGNGGFDAVVGNPPYFSVDTIRDNQKNYLQYVNSVFATKQSNIYFFFISIGNKVLKEKALLSFINERYYLDSKNATNFRTYLKENFTVTEIVDFSNIQIFEKVNTLTIINTFRNIKDDEKINIVQFNHDIRNINSLNIIKNNSRNFKLDQSILKSESWVFVNNELNEISNKISVHKTLDSFMEMGQGIKSGLNDVFIVDNEKIEKNNFNNKFLKKYVKTKDIQRFNISFRDLYLLLILKDTNIDEIPNIKNYLNVYKKELSNRYQFKDGTCKWYSLSIPQNLELFKKATEKILTPLYSKGNKFGYDNCSLEENFYSLTDVYILVKKKTTISTKYILGLLNSNLLNVINKFFGKLKRDGYYEYSRNTLSRFHIRDIDFNISKDKKFHDDLVSLVDQMLDLQKKYSDENLTSQQSKAYKRNIDEIDKEIDSIVYKLYGLTKEEIAIVEGNV